MDFLQIVLQLIVSLGILNVWLLRRDRATPYRGGGASSMKEEFKAYGLPAWSVPVVGVLKLTCALGLLLGIGLPFLIDPAASILGVLMFGAFVMHLKVKDPFVRGLPSILVLGLCVWILAL